ncbi:YgaP family membrane protein [Thiospirillum jenense]|uniref:DUF2892 domain-containing protein n=1 Tax=Thiospirillum jenense TaxID=1653858 RepID=A0A839HE19_9GAMM|nr:DUF2892 domain-containing protein [Thiospirillum jenense]MBB1125417.1 DUF2892 domain-containing protein [Thiospirillum jenense]
MIKNVGKTDRNLRFAVAGALVLAATLGGLDQTTSIILSVLGLVALGTAFVGFCPAYTVFKINTNKDGDA